MVRSAVQQQSDSRLYRQRYLLVKPVVLENLESEYNFENLHKKIVLFFGLGVAQK